MQNKTEELIVLLSNTGPVKPPLPLWASAVSVFLLSLLVTGLLLGFRPDVLSINPSQPLIQKLFWIGGAFLVSMVLSFRAAKPVGSVSAKPWLALVVVSGLLLLVQEWVTFGSNQNVSALYAEYFIDCFLSVTAFGALGAVIMAAHMRFFAPANIDHAAAAVGMAAGCAGALAYALHCPMDSPAYIIGAYAIPVLFLSGLARLILPRFLRW